METAKAHKELIINSKKLLNEIQVTCEDLCLNSLQKTMGSIKSFTK
jgi:hypothetical protein